MTLTPEQFNKIATKEDLKELEEKLVTKVEMNEKIDQVLTAIDGLAKSVNDFRAEMASNQGAHDRMSDNINDHEIKLKKLELKNA